MGKIFHLITAHFIPSCSKMKSLSEKISLKKRRRSIFSSSLFTNNKHHRFTYHSQARRRWTLYQMRWQTSESFYQGGSVLHNSWLSGDACLYIGRDLWHCSKNVSLGVCGEGCWIKNGCRHAEKVGDAVCGWMAQNPAMARSPPPACWLWQSGESWLQDFRRTAGESPRK